MTISFPLALPTNVTARSVRFRGRSTVGQSESPFSGEIQTYVHQLEVLEAEMALPPMSADEAEAWVAFLLALNGREGTFLMGPPGYTNPQGTWSGASPVVHGGSQSGRLLYVDGVSPFVAAAPGDWIQLGTTTGARLHKVLQAVTFDSGGEGALDLWPRIVSAPSDNAALTLTSPKGCFRLVSNVREWTIEEAMFYGITFAARQEV